jgi:alginate O-acetyltransferase complex protein AlgI
LYFDFSGYCDMAMGAALLFNIKLPLNFNSPYKAVNIQDFWHRWHMTLNRFLTQYVYFPLGGSRKGYVRTYVNIMIIFLVSGFWHGAGWTFIFWGFLHGLASVIYRWWHGRGLRMPKWLAWLITFQFVNVAWVFFRAESFGQAVTLVKIMFGFENFVLPARLAGWVQELTGASLFSDKPFLFETSTVSMIIVAFIIALFMRNSFELMQRFKPGVVQLLFLLIIMIVSVLQLGKVSEFLYFNF